jgi:hypothetical protein
MTEHQVWIGIAIMASVVGSGALALWFDDIAQKHRRRP